MDEQLSKLPAGLRLKNILCTVLPAVCITLALLVFGCACVAADLSDPASRYLTDKGSALVLLAVLLIAILLPISALAVFRGEKILKISIFAKLFSILPFASSIHLAYSTYINKEEIWRGITVSADGHLETVLKNIMPVCAILSAAFFILKIFDRSEVSRFICGLGVFSLATLIIASLYLDFSIELNSPYKLAVQFAAVGMMFSNMADMRNALSRTGAGRYVYLKGLSLTLSLLASGLILVAHLNGSGRLPEIYLSYSALYLCYSVATCAELAAQVASKVKSYI